MKTYTSYICNGSGTITLGLAFILEILVYVILFYSDFYLMNWFVCVFKYVINVLMNNIN